jgi:hypothetical protein
MFVTATDFVLASALTQLKWMRHYREAMQGQFAAWWKTSWKVTFHSEFFYLDLMPRFLLLLVASGLLWLLIEIVRWVAIHLAF